MKGHIRQRDNGSWVYVVDLPTDGERNQKWFTLDADTKDEAEYEAAKILVGLGRGGMTNPEDTPVPEYLDQWFESKVEGEKGANTADQYEYLLRCHVKPFFEGMTLGEIRPYHVDRLITEKRKNGKLNGGGGLSKSTVRTMHVVLSSALDHAVRMEMIGENPCQSVDAPSLETGDADYLHPDDIPRYLKAAEESRYYPVLFTALYTGMRQSELLGLLWPDVSDTHIHVRRQLTRRGKGTPKTLSSSREIAISPRTWDVLCEWKEQQEAEREKYAKVYEDTALVFTTARGTPYSHRNTLRAHHQTLKRAGMEKVGFHALRHTHATKLLLSGVLPKVVQERLGHGSIQQTIDTYSHVIPSMQDELAASLDDMMEG